MPCDITQHIKNCVGNISLVRKVGNGIFCWNEPRRQETLKVEQCSVAHF